MTERAERDTPSPCGSPSPSSPSSPSLSSPSSPSFVDFALREGFRPAHAPPHPARSGPPLRLPRYDAASARIQRSVRLQVHRDPGGIRSAHSRHGGPPPDGGLARQSPAAAGGHGDRPVVDSRDRRRR